MERRSDRDAYERAGGYRALRKALQSMTPEAVTEEVKILEPARPRRRRLPHGAEVDFHPMGGRAAPEIPGC